MFLKPLFLETAAKASHLDIPFYIQVIDVETWRLNKPRAFRCKVSNESSYRVRGAASWGNILNKSFVGTNKRECKDRNATHFGKIATFFVSPAAESVPFQVTSH